MARVMEHHAAASFTHCLSAKQTITYVGLSVTPDALEVELDGKSYITLNVPEGRARLIGYLGASGCSQRIVCEQAAGAESAIVLALFAAGFTVGVVPTSAVQRGPAGTFSYVIGEGDIVKAVPVTVTQQTETEAVIAKGLSPTDRVVTTGFANLAEGTKVSVGSNSAEPAADLAPRARGGKRGEQEQRECGSERHLPSASACSRLPGLCRDQLGRLF